MIRESESSQLNSLRSDMRSERISKMSNFGLESPMEQALAILRPIAAEQADDDGNSPLQEVIDIIEANAANFAVDMKDELDRLEEKGTEVDSDVRAYLMETAGDTESAELEMPNWGDFRKIIGRVAEDEEAEKDGKVQAAPVPTIELAPPPDLLTKAKLDWDYDVGYLDSEAKGRGLSMLFLHLLDERGLVNTLDFDRPKLLDFIRAIETDYGDNPYHSRVHGADVLLGMHLFIQPFAKVLSPWQHFAALFAAACHDFNHPGTTNAHEIKVSSERALKYHDDSVLESHHLEQTFRKLLEPRYNFMAHCSREMYVDVRKLVITLTLHTDLSKHFNFISRIKSMAEGSLQAQLDGVLKGEEPPNLARKNTRQSITKAQDNSEKTADIELFLSTGIKYADLGHSIKPWALHERWSLAITEELWRIGDFERENGIPIGPLCDRENDTNLSKSQRGFLEFVIIPFFKAVVRAFPIREPCMKNLDANFKRWSAYPTSAQAAPVFQANYGSPRST
mmetsp:Transcript_13808/g.36201  ORF Transcript_13808/g.36201 Transcript_13808/m.36201 type:complete len:508 (+) Transcript_13808:189-1712(+)